MLEIENKQLCESCFSEISESPCPFCGFSREKYSPLSSVLPVGYMLRNRYRIGSVIGQGGFGITYRAYDTKYNEIISIKEYYPSSLAVRSGSTLSVSATSLDYFDLFKSGVEKFCNEAKLVSRFNGNPNIVSVYEYFYENETAYFSMEFLKGETLKSYIDNNGVVTPEEALDMFLELSSALIVAHSADVLHRDISPDNIMLLVGGGIKLIDFGAARQVIANDPKSKSVILKDGFAPLEQYIRKGNQGPWTDIYSLGATIYYALTKERLDNPMTRLEDNDERFMSSKSTINEQLWNIIHKCIQIKYQDRYQNAFKLKDDLKQVDFKPSKIVLYGNYERIDSPPVKETNATQVEDIIAQDKTVCILPQNSNFKFNNDQKEHIHNPTEKNSDSKFVSNTISDDDLNSVINELYKSIKEKNRSTIFPEGVLSVKEITTSIANNIFKELNESIIRLCFDVYVRTWVWISLGIENNRVIWLSDIKSDITTEAYKNISSHMIEIIIDESFQKILPNFPEYESHYYMSVISSEEMRRYTKANRRLQDLFLSDKEYGLVPNKPIFVNGFSDFNNYINNIMTEKREKLTNVRKGSMKVNGIAGPVDVVESFLPNGKLYGTIYISVYSNNARVSVPKGYLYIGNVSNDDLITNQVNNRNGKSNDSIKSNQTQVLESRTFDKKEERNIIRKISGNSFVKRLKEMHYEHTIKNKINIIIAIFVFLLLPTYFVIITHVMATDINNTAACLIVLSIFSLCYLIWLYFIPRVTLRDNFNEFCLKVVSMSGESYVSTFEMLSKMRSSIYFTNFFFNTKYIFAFNSGLNDTKITFKMTADLSSILTGYDKKTKSWNITLKFLNESIIVLPLKKEDYMNSLAKEITGAWRVSKL